MALLAMQPLTENVCGKHSVCEQQSDWQDAP